MQTTMARNVSHVASSIALTGSRRGERVRAVPDASVGFPVPIIYPYTYSERPRRNDRVIYSENDGRVRGAFYSYKKRTTCGRRRRGRRVGVPAAETGMSTVRRSDATPRPRGQ